MDELTQRQRIVWSVGDYPDIARTIEPVAHEVVAAVGLQAGETLLDVATDGRYLAHPEYLLTVVRAAG